MHPAFQLITLEDFADRREFESWLQHPGPWIAGFDFPFGFALTGSTQLLNSLVNDATDDRLDAVLCAMQATWAWQRRDDNYGLAADVDPLEGWIAVVPHPPV